ncbi:DnaB-like helicase C-terminal domain-containing protein [Serratia fonticola]|uniref:DnaB-like helicase C-terminal domain-containing protein n=1 Tax=Serratia fonticola TaxID=47917 RepID=UPI00093EEC82|nr:DnaB-like helicase C-terminal domain-containing protein [Serratia fonticola]OKP29412.1 helicase DnaB [Serratia fonticola]
MTDDYKVPPSNIDAEQSVLGGVMLDAQSDRVQKVFSFLTDSMFYSRQHGVIYRAMKAMNAANETLDLLTVASRLEATGDIEQVGGFAYLAELSKNTPSAANIIAYANAVKDKSVERMAIEKTSSMLELLYARNGMTTGQKLEAVQSLAMQIDDKAKSGNTRGLVPFSDAMQEWMDVVSGRLSQDPASIGLTSGIKALDEVLEPKRIVKGSLFVIGARPKMGKTTLYTTMAINCALNENLPALAFSLEMPRVQLAENMISQNSRVNSKVFYLDGYDDNKFAMASAKGLELAQNGNLFIDDTPGLSLSHIVAESRRIKRERGAVGMVLVDYLTLMKAEKAERNDLAYGMITKGLKNLAKELGCVVVLLTQLNRDLEKRTNKRPLPSDSRDTGQIEQDCDYWLGIYREGAYDDNVNQAETEYLLRLNRHGEAGVVYADQRHGVIYEVDQAQAKQARDQREEKPYKKRDF